MRRETIFTLVLLLAMTAAATVQAATATTSFAVTATVLSSCAVTAAPLVFGAYDPAAGTAINGSNTLVVLCTTGTPYTVALGVGNGPGATVATRKMGNLLNSDLLNYTLYQNAARSTQWGSTVGTDTLAATAAIPASTINVYGQIFSGQNVSAGAYTDTVNVTVTY